MNQLIELGAVIAIVTVVMSAGAFISARFVSKDACSQCKQGIIEKIDALQALLQEKFKAIEELIKQWNR